METHEPNYHRRSILYEEYMALELGVRKEDYLKWLKMMHKEDYDKEMTIEHG